MKTFTSLEAFDRLLQDLSPQYGAGEARSIARIIFEDVFGTRRPGDQLLLPDAVTRFWDIHRRLLTGEPLQYVLGRADFFGKKFKVSPAVLIPRQETEELVAWVSDWLAATRIAAPALLDIGLGSGCIAITLKATHPEIRLYGLEKSPESLALACENAELLLGNADFQFVPGDILNRRDWEKFPLLDVIVSNPPYIPEAERPLVPPHVRNHEPPEALFVPGDDPLLFYRTIAACGLEKLRSGGALFFECNEFNATEVIELLDLPGYVRTELRKDLSGANRMVAAFRR